VTKEVLTARRGGPFSLLSLSGTKLHGHHLTTKQLDLANDGLGSGLGLDMTSTGEGEFHGHPFPVSPPPPGALLLTVVRLMELVCRRLGTRISCSEFLASLDAPLFTTTTSATTAEPHSMGMTSQSHSSNNNLLVINTNDTGLSVSPRTRTTALDGGGGNAAAGGAGTNNVKSSGPSVPGSPVNKCVRLFAPGPIRWPAPEA
jgi:hypothetical protein